MTMNPGTLDRLAKAFGNQDSFECPHCKAVINVEGGDGEVLEQVISYWGDDLHEFTCDQCGKDFVVKEIVTRQFETARTAEELL